MNDLKLPSPKHLLPHSGDMLFIEEIIDFDEKSILTKTKILDRKMFLIKNRFPSFQTMEMMAQSLGCLRGILEKNNASKLGFLLGSRGFKIFVPFLEVGEELFIKAEISLYDENGFGVYDCKTFRKNNEIITQGSISVLNPQENFMKDFYAK